MSQDVDYIIDECQKIAKCNDLHLEWESGVLYPYNITVNFTDIKDNKVKIFKYNDITTTPEEFVMNITSTISEWCSRKKVEPKPKPKLVGDEYRKQLVEQIKAAGQDLIDRAESFVAEDLKMIGGFGIEIDIPQDGPVEIVTRMKTYCMSDEYYKATNVLYADDKPVLVMKGE